MMPTPQPYTPRASQRIIQRLAGRAPRPATPPAEPPGAVLGAVSSRGIVWTIRRSQKFAHEWFDIIVEREPTPDHAERRRAGNRRRWQLRWNSYKERLTESPVSLLLAFRDTELFVGVQAVLLGRSF